MRENTPAETWKVTPLATESKVVFQAPDPGGTSLHSPSIEVLTGGRIVVAFEQSGPGVKTLPGKKYKDPHGRQWAQVTVVTSNDLGATWTESVRFPCSRGCVFRDGRMLYLLGDTGDLQIARSANGGSSWNQLKQLKLPGSVRPGTVQAPKSALLASEHVYLSTTTVVDAGARSDTSHATAAVVMSGAQGSDLTRSMNWRYVEPVTPFRDLVPQEKLDFFGIPFFDVPHAHKAEAVAPGRWAQRVGWQRGQLVEVRDPSHYWHDPSGRTVHLLAPATTHRSNIAALAKITDDGTGPLSMTLETTPAGTSCAFLALPGGNLDFHVVYDDQSKLYWSAANQVRDSMRRADKLPKQQYGLPGDERHRLQLHFSHNLVDWTFAGCIDIGSSPREVRCECRLAVRGDDLCVLYCAADKEAKSARFPNILKLAVLPAFRELVY